MANEKKLKKNKKVIIIALVLVLVFSGGYYVVQTSIKNVVSNVINSASSLFSKVFDNTSDAPVMIIDDALIEQIKKELDSEKIDIDQTQTSNYLLKKAISAYYATRYPYIDTVNYTDDMVKGCIYLYTSDGTQMSYMSYPKFCANLGDGKTKKEVDRLRTYFSVNNNGEIAVYTYSRQYTIVEDYDASTGKTTKTGEEKDTYVLEEYPIDKDSFKQYAMSYKLPIMLANMYGNEGFGVAVAEMAENSRIELTILDNITTTTTTTKDYYNMHYKGDATISYTKGGISQSAVCDQAIWNEDYTKTPKTTTVDVYEYNALNVQVTKLDTWVVKGEAGAIQKTEEVIDPENPDVIEAINNPSDYTTNSQKSGTYNFVDSVEPSEVRSKVSSKASEIGGTDRPNAGGDAQAADQSEVTTITSIGVTVQNKMTDHKVSTHVKEETTSYTALAVTLEDNTDKFLALIRANDSGEYDPNGELQEYFVKLDENGNGIGDDIDGDIIENGDPIKHSADDVTILAAVMTGEMGGAKDDEAIYAVGMTVINRIRSKKFPNTMKGVVSEKNQYALCYANGKTKDGKPPTKKCIKIAKELLAGKNKYKIPKWVYYEMTTEAYNERNADGTYAQDLAHGSRIKHWKTYNQSQIGSGGKPTILFGE